MLLNLQFCSIGVFDFCYLNLFDSGLLFIYCHFSACILIDLQRFSMPWWVSRFSDDLFGPFLRAASIGTMITTQSTVHAIKN